MGDFFSLLGSRHNLNCSRFRLTQDETGANEGIGSVLVSGPRKENLEENKGLEKKVLIGEALTVARKEKITRTIAVSFYASVGPKSKTPI